MKFTATDFWNAVALGTSKIVVNRVYIRKTADLTLALTGTWTEITNRVVSVPDINLRVEFELGQFVANSISFQGLDIAWFKANVFNATASEYIELKAEMSLGLSETRLATDTCYQFSGIVDKRVQYSEENDSVKFRAFTPDDLLEGFGIANVTTQYIHPDVDGSGTAGQILFDIPGVWVTDCNVASYVLRAGIHTLTYEYNGGSPQIKLDDGEFVSLTGGAGTKTLSNRLVDQKLVVYRDSTLLSTTDAVEKIIVITPGTTLPNHFYFAANIKRIVTKIFSFCGITTITFDTMEFDSWDGGGRVSFIELPPSDETVSGYKKALATDATDLWIGVGNKLYKRTMSTDAYTLKATCDSGYHIVKLFYNARNTHLWAVLYNGSVWRVIRYDIGGDSLSSSVVISATSGHSIQIVDFEYSASNYVYGLCYVDESAGQIRFVNSSVADTLIGTMTDVKDGFAYIKNGNEYWAQVEVGGVYTADAFEVDGTGAWVGLAAVGHPMVVYDAAAYIESENRLYFWDSAALKVKSHIHGAGATTDLLTLSSGDSVDGMHFANAKIYFTTKTNGDLYQAVSNAATLLYDQEKTYCPLGGLAYIDRLYGLDEYGILFQYHTVIRMFVREAHGDGSVKALLHKIMNAYLCLYTLSPAKLAKVYRRGNSSGTPQSSGNNIDITADEASVLDENPLRYEAVELVRVSNGTVSHLYDGTTFDADVLTDKRILEITNDFIPDSIVKDVCYFLYQFVKTDRTLYSISLGRIPLFQYEPIDGAAITFTGKIQKTGTGVIYGAGYGQNGDLILEVML